MGYDYMAYMDYLDLAVRCAQKAVEFNHSLTHSLGSLYTIMFILPAMKELRDHKIQWSLYKGYTAEDKDLFMLYCQYHGRWWTGKARASLAMVLS